MKDSISIALELLAAGLRPYVVARATSQSYDAHFIADIERGDAQFLLVFMWDRWNDLFRDDLSFVERSLISELRDFRNRWAHQSQMTKQDQYRVLDGIERLLRSIKSDQLDNASELRREALDQLWQSEIGQSHERSSFQRVWPFLLCMVSAAAICFAFFWFLSMPWNMILSMLVLVGLFRLAWYQSVRDSVRTVGPKECRDCGKIIYTVQCPYCRPAELNAAYDFPKVVPSPITNLLIARQTADTWQRRPTAAREESK